MAAKSVEADILTLAKFLILSDEVRAIEERPFSYQSEKKAAREKAMEAYTLHLPAVREILIREKR